MVCLVGLYLSSCVFHLNLSHKKSFLGTLKPLCVFLKHSLFCFQNCIEVLIVDCLSLFGFYKKLSLDFLCGYLLGFLRIEDI